jgi:general secretion pathway protein G
MHAPRSTRLAPGFTFIEISLVVALIGILAVVALPYYNGHKLQAQDTQAVNDITAMSLAIQNYWNDNRSYPATLSDVGLANKNDPWGHAYVYYNIAANGKGGARKDHALNPINTDFDLYSAGPDGQSKAQITQKESLDDVIRANNGDFVGVAATF